MFKRSLLAVVLAGLIAGSAKSEEQKTNTIAEKVQNLKEVVHNSYVPNAIALTTSGYFGALFLIGAVADIFSRDTVTQEYSFFQGNVSKDIAAKDFVAPIRSNLMIAGACGLVAAYNAWVLWVGKRKTQALDEIKEELEAQ